MLGIISVLSGEMKQHVNMALERLNWDGIMHCLHQLRGETMNKLGIYNSLIHF